MKRTSISLPALLLALLLALSLGGCAEKKAEGVWADATYTEDKTFGSGAVTIEVEVEAEEKSVTFTIKTDEEMLGAALLEHGLIAGEMGDYGMYVKEVNGMLADYDVDQTYWGSFKDSEYLMTGVDTTPIADGEHYELVRTAG